MRTARSVTRFTASGLECSSRVTQENLSHHRMAELRELISMAVLASLASHILRVIRSLGVLGK